MALTFPYQEMYENESFSGLLDMELELEGQGLEGQVWPMGSYSMTEFLDSKDEMLTFGANSQRSPKKPSKKSIGDISGSIKQHGSSTAGSKPVKKRKTQCTKAKELSKRRQNLAGLVQRNIPNTSVIPEPIQYDFKSRSQMVSNPNPFHDDFSDISSFWLNGSEDFTLNQGKVPKRQLGSKQKEKRSKSRKSQVRTLSLMRTRQLLDSINNKKRLKWSDDENYNLWRGISIHGNNWTEVKKEVTTRSYDQIKDKGRRLLFVEGWKTGRKKKSSDEAMDYARNIALRVLKTLKPANDAPSKTFEA